MSVLLKIGPISFDINTIISFLIGISFGFFILLLVYLYAVLRSLNKNLRFKKADVVDIDIEEIKWLITDGQSQFKDKKNRTKNRYAKHLGMICKDLTIDIATKFYPKSKYPYLELTIDEVLHLNHYITNRVDELLKSRILHLFRGMTLRAIIEANEIKTNIENSAVVKTAKKYQVGKVAKATFTVLNVLNPAYWIKRLTKEVILEIVMTKIGLAIIAITGEETYKIYSKKVFNEERTIDTGVNQIYDELSEELRKESEKNG